MSDAIHWDPTGKPFAKCPACGHYHSISRRQDYLDKPALRFQCRNPECRGVTWRATDEERAKLLAYFSQLKGRGRGRPSTKPAARTNQTDPKPPEPSQNTETTKKSIWEKLI